jgi:hypothetical protein
MRRDRPHHIEPDLKSARVILVYKNFAPPGQSSLVGLGVTALATARTLRRHGIWAEAWGCTSAQHILQRLARANDHATRDGLTPISHVVISAPWLKTEEVELLASERPEIVFAVECHSSWPFLQADPDAIARMRETIDLERGSHNVFLAGNSLKLTQPASEIFGTSVVFLPNLYDLSDAPPAHRRPWRDGDTLHIGLFGAMRTLKNVIGGAAAALDLAARLRVPTKLYLSASRDDHSLESIALRQLTENVDHFEVIRASWRRAPAFKSLVARMDLLIQVSFSESFNMVTADGVAVNVPSVVSPAIDWTPRHWQANPDDVRDIVRVAEQLLHDRNAAREGREALEHYVSAGLRHWHEFLLGRADARVS